MNQDIKPYVKRSVLVCDTRLCSATQNGATLLHYFYLLVGGKRTLFDIRTIRPKGRVFPAPMFHQGEDYEMFLRSELRRAAEWVENC